MKLKEGWIDKYFDEFNNIERIRRDANAGKQRKMAMAKRK